MIKKSLLLTMVSILCLTAIYAQSEEVVVNMQIKTVLKSSTANLSFGKPSIIPQRCNNMQLKNIAIQWESIRK